MRALWLNRLTIFLSFAGIYIAGVLTLSHYMHKEIPCGGSNDCEAVANDPSSMIGGVPVALIGLLAYVIFAAFGLARAFGGVVKLRKLTVIGFGLSIVGLLESTSLTIYSLTKIQATCKWCIASAITMALLMVAQAWLAQETKQEEQDTDTAMVPSLIAIVAFGLLGFQASQLARAATINPISRDIIERTPLAELVPPDAPFIGNANAPVTIVEFGDVRCPACRTSWSKMKERVKNAQGNIKWVFRHFPFFEKVEHRLSVPAAVLSYYCAPTGGFFPYVESCFSADPKQFEDLAPYLLIVRALKVDEKAAMLTLKDKNAVPYLKLKADIDLGRKLGIGETPTFLILIKGQAPISASLNNYEWFLDNDENIKRALAGG